MLVKEWLVQTCPWHDETLTTVDALEDVDPPQIVLATCADVLASARKGLKTTNL